MAQDEGGLTQPLLTDSEEDRLWDRVEAAQQGPPGEIDDANAPFEITTVPELLKGNPNQVLRTISAAGVRRLGEFSVRDHLIIGRLKEDTILTMGSKNAVIDYERAWKQELAQSSGCGIFAEDARSNSEANPDEQNGNKDTGWSTQIPVIAYVVTIRNAAAPDTEGLLHPLLCRWQSGGCSFGVFALPAVHAVIEYKWRNYARRALLAELACFLLWLFSFYAFTWLFQDEDTSLSLRELLQTQRGQFAVLFNVLSLLGMAPFVLIEVCSMAAYGLWGWATTWNILDCVTYTIQVRREGEECAEYSFYLRHMGCFD